MSETKLEREYHCWDDCEMGGCPGHTAVLEYQSDSEALHFSDGKGSDLYMQTPELKAFMSMLRELGDSRVEIESALMPSIDLGDVSIRRFVAGEPIGKNNMVSIGSNGKVYRANGGQLELNEIEAALEIVRRHADQHASIWDGFEEAAEKLKAMSEEPKQQSWLARLKWRFARWFRH